VTQRPQFSNIDVWGLTHPGKVRPDNQDHYFTGSLARGVRVDGTSIEEAEQSELHIERLATLAMVAECVGGTAGGEEGARLTVLELVSSVSKTFHQAGALTQISRARRWRRPSTTTVRARGPWQTAAGGPMWCRARWVDNRLSPS
jgi:serine/threonine protein phosphatase PrpC